MTVWTVNSWHMPEVSHGFEVIGIYSTKERAEAAAAAARVAQAAFNEAVSALGSTQFHNDFEVEEWTVDAA